MRSSVWDNPEYRRQFINALPSDFEAALNIFVKLAACPELSCLNCGEVRIKHDLMRMHGSCRCGCLWTLDI